jgi:hypothetical protein
MQLPAPEKPVQSKKKKKGGGMKKIKYLAKARKTLILRIWPAFFLL